MESSRIRCPDLKSTMAKGLTDKSLQLCLTLCDAIDDSPPGSTVPGILQARTLEWVAISFSNAWKWKVKVRSLSRVRLFATPWTVAYQPFPSMGFSRQEYWSGMPSPSPKGLTGFHEFWWEKYSVFIFSKFQVKCSGVFFSVLNIDNKLQQYTQYQWHFVRNKNYRYFHITSQLLQILCNITCAHHYLNIIEVTGLTIRSYYGTHRIKSTYIAILQIWAFMFR